MSEQPNMDGESHTKTTASEGTGTLASSLQELTSLFGQLKSHMEAEPDADPTMSSQTLTYFRQKAKRMALSYFSGKCRVCNNLEPDGHEDSSTGAHGALDPWGKFVHGGDLKESREEAHSTPSLFLEDIKLDDLLQCRKWRDGIGGAGRWENDCRFCRFLCDVLDAIYFNWVWTQPYQMSSKSISLTIRKGFPLVLTARNIIHCSPGAGYREDIDIYQHPPGVHDPTAETRKREWDEFQTMNKGNANEEEPAEVQAASFETKDNGKSKVKDEESAESQLLPIFGLAMPRYARSDSAECFDLITDCYTECLENHPLCGEIGPDVNEFVPSRLMYVGGSNDELRLCENMRIDPDTRVKPVWAALSHCWGGGRGIHKLTAASIDAMKMSIDHEVLPATFQDAIRVVRLLKLKYIWIDSLCIIQDSRLDWETEAAQMGNVYTCAAIVISGETAMNPTIHILRERGSRYTPRNLTFTTANGTTHEVLARIRHVWTGAVTQGLKEPPYTSIWATLPPFKALKSRAWVFQEEFLARRNVIFEEGGLVWKCKMHQRTEGYLPPYPDLRDGALGEVQVDRKWHQIVKAYSCRNLSFASDRLPALSGVAALVAQWKKLQWQNDEQDSENIPASQNYAAGLWRNTLVPDLLWATMPGSSHRPLAYPRGTYIAPSWSWASLSHGVVWTPYRNLESLSAPSKALVQLRKPAEGSTRPPNPYGEITDAIIVYRARKLRCWVTYDTHEREYFMHFDRPDGSSSPKQWIRSDGLLIPVEITMQPADGEEGGGEEMKILRRAFPGETDAGLGNMKATAWFLCLAKTSPMNFDHIGLVLGLSSQQGRMGRVGFASNVPGEWWETGSGEDKDDILS